MKPIARRIGWYNLGILHYLMLCAKEQTRNIMRKHVHAIGPALYNNALRGKRYVPAWNAKI